MNNDQIPSLDLRKLKVLAPLGRGARGVVFLVRDESSNGELFALKTILKSSITKNVKKIDNENFIEHEVLGLLHHPLLPKLRGVLSTDNIVGYAIDYCCGRDLNCLRKKQTERMFSDDVIRFYAAELVLALEYLHELRIVYRDLKPENIMIQENGHVMLIDFDLSTKLSLKSPSENQSTNAVLSPLKQNLSANNKKYRFQIFCCGNTIPSDLVHPAESMISEPSHSTHSNSFVGTEEYISPEMLTGNGHGFSVDWWCLGVVLYEMLYGTTPFKGKNRKETFYNIISKPPGLIGEPTALRDLIRKLLVKDPNQRISTVEIKRHDFFQGVDWERIVEIARPPFLPKPLDELDEEGMDVNKIDVEGFVQNVFQVDDDEQLVQEKDVSHDFLIF